VAGVIRREQRAATATFSFADIQRQGDAIVARARAEAQRMLHTAEQEAQRAAERIRREALERGMEQGRQAGMKQVREEASQAAMQEARARLDRLAQALERALHEFDQGKRRLLAQAESGLIELALAIAARVCKLKAGSGCDVAIGNARHVLEMAAHEHDVELRVHPDELEALQSAAVELIHPAGGLQHVRVVADAHVERGGCVLRSRAGTVDASLETQLQRVAEAIVGETTSAG